MLKMLKKVLPWMWFFRFLPRPIQFSLFGPVFLRKYAGWYVDYERAVKMEPRIKIMREGIMAANKILATQDPAAIVKVCPGTSPQMKAMFKQQRDVARSEAIEAVMQGRSYRTL